jgi:hypothetical protein
MIQMTRLARTAPAITVSVFLLFCSACSKSSLSVSNPGSGAASLAQVRDTMPPVVYQNRDEALADYENNYLGSEYDNVGWTGNTDNCEAGTTSQVNKDKVLQRLNYFRRLAGLPDNVVLVDSLNEKAQQAALIMKANNQLNHYPGADWHCSTPAGQDGAANSDIALGASGPAAVTLYMQDAGVTDLGHRRWILFPSLASAGSGDTDFSNAIYLIGGFGARPAMPFVAYPGNGYTPAPLVFQTWSFSVPAADFSRAAISVTGPGNVPAGITVNALPNGYGDNAVSWNMNDLQTGNLTADQSYEVSVSGVKVAGQIVNYHYTVQIMAVPAQ